MAQEESIAVFNLRVHTGNIITDRISFPLIIMVLSCHPDRFAASVLHPFVSVKLPDDVSIPVNLYEIKLVLETIFLIS